MELTQEQQAREMKIDNLLKKLTGTVEENEVAVARCRTSLTPLVKREPTEGGNSEAAAASLPSPREQRLAKRERVEIFLQNKTGEGVSSHNTHATMSVRPTSKPVRSQNNCLSASCQ